MSSYKNEAYVGDNLGTTVGYTSASKPRRKCSCCMIVLLVLGVVGTVFNIAMLAGGYDAMFDSIMRSQMAVVEGTQSYDMWKLTPVPLYIYIYFFNITNPEEFQNGAKPILEEVGPYVYREYHQKQNLTHNANHTVTFMQERWWTWEPELSGDRTKEDIIVTVNTIPVSAAWSVRDKPLQLWGLNQNLKDVGEELIVAVPAGDLMFDGCSDPLLDWMQQEIVWENGTYHNISSNLPLPPGLTDYDKFGWFYGRNHSLTYDGIFNMYTGEDSLDKLGLVSWWNYANDTNFFPEPCNQVQGSAGEMWPRNLKRDYIQFYSSDLCMTLKLHYKEDVVDKNGIEGYRFWANTDTFTWGDDDYTQACYVVDGTRGPPGTLNAESCRMGSPAFISLPHFYMADPQLREEVEGLNPSFEKHAFYMDMIPQLGTPMWVAARMQINLQVKQYNKIDLLKNVKDVIIPLMWFEEQAGVPDDMAGQVRALQFIMTSPTMTIVFSSMLGVSLLVLIGVLAKYFRG